MGAKRFFTPQKGINGLWAEIYLRLRIVRGTVDVSRQGLEEEGQTDRVEVSTPMTLWDCNFPVDAQRRALVEAGKLCFSKSFTTTHSGIYAMPLVYRRKQHDCSYQAKRNAHAIVGYPNKMLERHARLVIVRLYLGYKGASQYMEAIIDK